jgi:hypothetical protein
MSDGTESSAYEATQGRGFSDLLYFACDIEGRRYGGWYRFLPRSHIEVIARGQVKTRKCGDDVFPQDLADELLTEIVRETRGLITDDEWPGYPVGSES